jgi:hypothetical protein
MNESSEPSFLYRYFSVERCRTLLAEGRLFFPCAADFNDPFECDPMFNFKTTAHERLRYNMELLKEKAPAMRKYERKKFAKKAATPESFAEAARRLTDRLKQTVGILSLCEIHDNLLMWAHYAASHTGICAELRRDGPPLDLALKVVYSHDYPRVDFFETARAIEGSDDAAQLAQRKWVDAIFLTKSIDWSYEQEWRVLDTIGGRRRHTFGPELLTKIYLGCKLSAADEKRVREWIAEGPTRPRIFRAIRERRSFALCFEEV